MREKKYLDRDSIVWPWNIDYKNYDIMTVNLKLKEHGFDLSRFENIKKDSKEHKASLKMLEHLAMDKEHSWLMLGSESMEKLLDYGHRLAALFAYSLCFSVCMFDPAKSPEMLDADPEDDEMSLLWKSGLLILINGTLPVSRKYRQEKLRGLLLNRAMYSKRTLWLEYHIPGEGESSEDIFRHKMSSAPDIMSEVMGHFRFAGSFFWLKAEPQKETKCENMEA